MTFVSGHGMVPRMKVLSPENNKKIEEAFAKAKENKSDFAWHRPFNESGNVILDDFIIFNKFSLLENGQLLYEGDPVPYDVKPTPEFLQRQKAESVAGEIERTNQRNRLDNERIQREKDIKEEMRKMAIERLEGRKATEKSHEQAQQQEILDELAKSQINVSPPATPTGDPIEN